MNSINFIKLYLLAWLGDVKSQSALGDMYFIGGYRMVTRYIKAMRWYLKAANQGHMDAHDKLGYMYECGLGVHKNYTEAVRLYQLAAEQGHIDAQCSLGRMYKLGRGVAKNQYTAEAWYRKAADQGHITAKNEMEYRNKYNAYETVSPPGYNNQDEAVRWYNLAVQNNFEDFLTIWSREHTK